MYSSIEEIPRKTVSKEWDGGWFCDKCFRLNHFRTRAYMIGNKKYCCVCAEQEVKKCEK